MPRTETSQHECLCLSSHPIERKQAFVSLKKHARYVNKKQLIIQGLLSIAVTLTWRILYSAVFCSLKWIPTRVIATPIQLWTTFWTRMSHDRDYRKESRGEWPWLSICTRNHRISRLKGWPSPVATSHRLETLICGCMPTQIYRVTIHSSMLPM